jgi:SNF2 family DNA or RNA helicase
MTQLPKPTSATPFQSKYWATQLALRSAGGSINQLSGAISNARVDLNPHQVDAALFAVRSPFSKGVILADEVGLGKTIEAGLVLSQYWAERRRRILVIVPATLRKQWAQELEEKFHLPAVVLDATSSKKIVKAGQANPFQQDDRIVVCSYHFAANRSATVTGYRWDLVVIDEAHRLRNVYKKSNKMAQTLMQALRPYSKVMLTATPLQNSLMELYGLVSFIDPHIFGDQLSFREQFVLTCYRCVSAPCAGRCWNTSSSRSASRSPGSFIPARRSKSCTRASPPSCSERSCMHCRMRSAP